MNLYTFEIPFYLEHRFKNTLIGGKMKCAFCKLDFDLE